MKLYYGDVVDDDDGDNTKIFSIIIWQNRTGFVFGLPHACVDKAFEYGRPTWYIGWYYRVNDAEAWRRSQITIEERWRRDAVSARLIFGLQKKYKAFVFAWFTGRHLASSAPTA